IPVVLGAGWPGVLLHEAVGLGLEGEFNRRGTSVFSGLMGQRVSSELCTVVDEGPIEGLRGWLALDEEGGRGEQTELLVVGILYGYM
ncbi:metallopeptidase TldD-related protein, partial [Erwinia amylovora]|uniref:metallopeptidase TldD-related protein n=1 Tax=Erwinia amylovora TaxID=552 RepID=UPI0020BE421A